MFEEAPVLGALRQLRKRISRLERETEGAVAEAVRLGDLIEVARDELAALEDPQPPP